ncbi:IS6 family transposase [Streptomyces sp. NPDC002669]|uniref:IS6 family transposase n=1 Tax=Streptomyces sp. NPDC002669 TaxID=3364658 RepID=UPI0036C73DA3
MPGRGRSCRQRRRRAGGHRYPVEVISPCVWLYFRFPLPFREVEELMLQRGVIVSHETVRRWCMKFGHACANGLRSRRPWPGDKRHLDEVSVRINGERKYLWRAVDADADGTVLDILVQGRRGRAATRRFFRSVGGIQRFPAAFSGISPHFRPCRHLMTATHYRIRFTVWDQATGITALPTTA